MKNVVCPYFMKVNRLFFIYLLLKYSISKKTQYRILIALTNNPITKLNKKIMNNNKIKLLK